MNPAKQIGRVITHTERSTRRAFDDPKQAMYVIDYNLALSNGDGVESCMVDLTRLLSGKIKGNAMWQERMGRLKIKYASESEMLAEAEWAINSGNFPESTSHADAMRRVSICEFLPRRGQAFEQGTNLLTPPITAHLLDPTTAVKETTGGKGAGKRYIINKARIDHETSLSSQFGERMDGESLLAGMERRIKKHVPHRGASIGLAIWLKVLEATRCKGHQSVTMQITMRDIKMLLGDAVKWRGTRVFVVMDSAGEQNARDFLLACRVLRELQAIAQMVKIPYGSNGFHTFSVDEIHGQLLGGDAPPLELDSALFRIYSSPCVMEKSGGVEVIADFCSRLWNSDHRLVWAFLVMELNTIGNGRFYTAEQIAHAAYGVMPDKRMRDRVDEAMRQMIKMKVCRATKQRGGWFIQSPLAGDLLDIVASWQLSSVPSPL